MVFNHTKNSKFQAGEEQHDLFLDRGERNIKKKCQAFCKNFVHFYKTKVFPVVHLVFYRRKLDKSEISWYLLSSLAVF